MLNIRDELDNSKRPNRGETPSGSAVTSQNKTLSFYHLMRKAY